jgi:hypothetical protein
MPAALQLLQFCHGYDGSFLDCARLFQNAPYRVITAYPTGVGREVVEGLGMLFPFGDLEAMVKCLMCAAAWEIPEDYPTCVEWRLPFFLPIRWRAGRSGNLCSPFPLPTTFVFNRVFRDEPTAYTFSDTLFRKVAILVSLVPGKLPLEF